MAMLKLATGRSWRATTSTLRTFWSCQRWTLGKLSSAGRGGGGALIRSLRSFQKVGMAAGAPAPAAAAAAGALAAGVFSLGSYWTSTVDGLPAGLGGAGGALV